MEPFNPESGENVMTCPSCRAEVIQNAHYCVACGLDLHAEKSHQTRPEASTPSKGKPHFGKLSGLRRTLSTELLARERELNTLAKLNALVEGRIYEEGDVIIQKGEKNRDLFFLTEGCLEISTKEREGNVILNEFSAPNILGDLGFLFGFPRTATARAKTKVKVYILKYENMMREINEFPEWLSPLLSSFVSALKTLHDEVKGLKRKRDG